jgi:LysR family glycine cleavage system transcriptional activator
MPTRVPSTQALRALESFARHGSVWQAADELNLTRSAVSHQLRLLERDLGFRLTRRAGTRVELTAQGRAYADDVRRALSALLGSAARQSGRGVGGVLTVSCTPGFAAAWLCPRLGRFRDQSPDIDLRIVTPRRLEDVSERGTDLFVTFSTGVHPGMRVELLKRVVFTPLVSPSYLNRHEGFENPAELARAHLLHLDGPEDWQAWFTLAGLDPGLARRGTVLTDVNLVYNAVLAGQGVCMGDTFVCTAFMSEGRLVRPFDLAIRPERAYYLAIPEARADAPEVAAFRGWMASELARGG